MKLYYGGRDTRFNNRSQPKFSGSLDIVVRYGLTTHQVHSIRGVIAGSYVQGR